MPQPSPQWQRWPAPSAPQASAPQRPTVNPPGPALAQQQPRREPVARAQMEDPPPVPIAPRPSALRLPAPEELGVATAQWTPTTVPATPLDWNATHAQLNRLGAVSVQLVRLPCGRYRFTFVLPTADPQRSRHVEATGATETEAVHAALAHVTAMR